MEKQYVVEWSNKQKCFHVQTLHESMKVNQEQAVRGEDNDWSILYVASSYEEAITMCHSFRKTLHLSE